MSTRPSMISFKGKSVSRSKLTRATLTTRKIPYKVHLDGVDVTPWPLMETTAASMAMSAAAAAISASVTQNTADYLDLGTRIEEIPPAEPSSSLLHLQAATGGAAVGIPSLTAVAKLDEFYHRKSSSIMSVIPEESSAQVKMTKELIEEIHEERPGDNMAIPIMLHETPFLELFEMPSETRVSTDPDYEHEARDRELFVASNAAVKTRADAFLQTADLWVRTKWTQESRKQKRNQITMVTPWEIWDHANSGKDEDARAVTLRKRHIRKLATESAMAARGAHKSTSSMTDITVTDDQLSESSDKRSEGTDLRSAYSRFSVGYGGVTSDKKLMLDFGKEFKFAAMVVERLLQEHESKTNQMLYCGIPPKNALDPDLRYIYEPQTLWTFQTELSKDRCVTCMVWSQNPLIFAVGYGRYYFTPTNPDGLLNIWNIKNPILPERVIRLLSPVNACAFSKRHPNLLAIGQMKGSIVLVDISTSDCSVIFESAETGEPLWSITWLQMESHGEDEILLAGTQDGRIMRFRRSEQFKSVQMMRVARNQGSIRGISRVNTAAASVPTSHYTAVLTLCECPTEPDGYLVGTDDGCIHLCSAHYLHRHLAALACHLGPVYACVVSPFVDKIYLTCGADWTIRIWAQGIYDPLLTFSSSMEPVESAAWSPVDSCLFASVSGNEVSIWDLRRKSPAPAGTASWPTQDKLSVVTWAKDGALLVGDRVGRVHVMRVEGLPLPSFFQQKSLLSSLRKALKLTKPDLYAAFTKLGKPF